MNFKKDDILRCIDPGHITSLEKNAQYVVIDDGYGNNKDLISVRPLEQGTGQGNIFGVFRDRFEKVKYSEPVNTTDDLIRKYAEDLRKAVEAGTLTELSYIGVFSAFLFEYNRLEK